MELYPFPHLLVENFLEPSFAKICQEEILSLGMDSFDRYSNLFEQKWTFRDKNNLPTNCKKLFEIFESEDFMDKLSNLVGEKLYKDPTKNWWGIHIYDNGDYLDIHSDAGIHPVTKQKKHITLGLYLSKDWKPENGGYLELWEGNSVLSEKPEITVCCKKILPKFNTLILFVNNTVAWHGNPEPVKVDKEKRIFVTLSYLSDKHDNGKEKAYFVKRPSDPENEEKDRLRILRADSEKCKNVYNVNVFK